MRIPCYVKTLNGDVGVAQEGTALTYELKDNEILNGDNSIVLVSVKLENGQTELWLNNQLEETDDPNAITLF